MLRVSLSLNFPVAERIPRVSESSPLGLRQGHKKYNSTSGVVSLSSHRRHANCGRRRRRRPPQILITSIDFRHPPECYEYASYPTMRPSPAGAAAPWRQHGTMRQHGTSVASAASHAIMLLSLALAGGISSTRSRAAMPWGCTGQSCSADAGHISPDNGCRPVVGGITCVICDSHG